MIKIKKILSYIENGIKKIRRILYLVISVPAGYALCWECFRRRQGNYILIVDSLGDTLYTLGYLNEFKKQHKEEKLYIYISKRQLEVLEMYEGFSDENIICLSREQQRILFLYFSTRVGFHYLCKHKKLYVVHPGIYFRNTFEYICDYPNVDFANFIKTGILKLNQEAKFQYPNIVHSDKRPQIQEGVLKKGETVILCPYANSMACVPSIFFEVLAQILSEDGYQVYTNVTNDTEDIIPNTHRLYCNLKEFIEISDYSGYVIGVRSGIIDMALLSTAKVLAIYPENDRLSSFFNIAAIINREGIEQFSLSSNIKADVEKAYQFVKNNKPMKRSS